MTDTDDKLIKRITTCLEEFGMPKFQDRFPAMSVIQIIKDSGYWKERPQDNNQKHLTIYCGACGDAMKEKDYDPDVPGLEFYCIGCDKSVWMETNNNA